MSGGAVLRVYRGQLLSVAGLALCGLVFFILGLSMVVDERQSGGVSGVIAGAFTLLLSLWMGTVVATNRLVVTPDGLVYWSNLRRRFMAWSQIRSFEVGRSRSLLPWPGLVVRLDAGSVTVTCVSGTLRFVARTADELRDLRREHAPDPAAGGVSPCPEAS